MSIPPEFAQSLQDVINEIILAAKRRKAKIAIGIGFGLVPVFWPNGPGNFQTMQDGEAWAENANAGQLDAWAAECLAS